jgi:hypothetical protein
MKYFLDTEFIEGFHKPIFGKRRHFIDLISIGIVDEKGNEFSSISSEYDYDKADKWVKDNVILPLYLETVHGDNRNIYDVHNFHKHYGRTNKEIICDLVLWIYHDQYQYWMDATAEFIERGIKYGWGKDLNHEFYAYYADYDWVLFCSLFGRMIDLPAGFPMYCKDLKQMVDDKAYDYINNPNKAVHTFDNALSWVKNTRGYPKQKNEHTALDDAKWNFELYKFLQTI